MAHTHAELYNCGIKTITFPLLVALIQRSHQGSSLSPLAQFGGSHSKGEGPLRGRLTAKTRQCVNFCVGVVPGNINSFYPQLSTDFDCWCCFEPLVIVDGQLATSQHNHVSSLLRFVASAIEFCTCSSASYIATSTPPVMHINS